MEVTGGIAVVTGGASGLGLATAQTLLAAGAGVIVLDLPSSDGEKVVAQLGERARFAPADVTDPVDVAAALDTADDLGGPLRVVVNCAGTGSAHRVLGRDGVFPLDEFVRLVNINLVGTFNVLRLGAERIAAAEPVDGERGVIVNTASAAAFHGQVGQAAYSASKGGVTAMTLPLARDLASRLIRVVTIAPGNFETPLLRAAVADPWETLGVHVQHPKRLGHPSEFAALVAHVVANPMLNGEVIRLDGALRLPPR